MSNVIAKGISSTLNTAEKEAIRANIGLGTAAAANVTTSQTDTTPGRLLKVGDGGVLSAAISLASTDDVLLVRPTATYMGYGCINAPEPSAWFFYEVKKHNDAYAEITASSFTGTPKKYFTSIGGGVTPLWKQILHTGNMPIEPTVGTTANFKGGVNLIASGAQLTTTQAGLSTTRLFTDSGAILSVDGLWPVMFKNNNTERMRVSSNGNVLVGTTTDNGVDKLQVNGSLEASLFRSDSIVMPLVTEVFSDSPLTFGNTSGSWLVTINGTGTDNCIACVTYVVVTAAYGKTITLLGTSQHFTNGYIEAELSSSMVSTATLRVRRTTTGTMENVKINLLRIGGF